MKWGMKDFEIRMLTRLGNKGGMLRATGKKMEDKDTMMQGCAYLQFPL